MFSEESDELQIERDFLRFAQQLGSDDIGAMGGAAAPDAMGGAVEGEAGNPLDEKLDPSLPDDQEDALPDMDTDLQEKQAVKDLIPWDNFVIIFDPHYAQSLQDAQQLPEPKAKSKSFYLYYAPENKRIEGIVNRRLVGGYGQKEKLGDDFEFLKKLSPEGFPPDWKEKLFTDIDQLPAVENSKVKEELSKEQDEEEEKPEEEAEQKPEEKPEEEAPAPGAAPKKKTQELPKPKPAGKVAPNEVPLAATINQLRFKRFARLQKLKNL